MYRGAGGTYRGAGGTERGTALALRLGRTVAEGVTRARRTTRAGVAIARTNWFCTCVRLRLRAWTGRRGSRSAGTGPAPLSRTLDAAAAARPAGAEAVWPAAGSGVGSPRPAMSEIASPRSN